MAKQRLKTGEKILFGIIGIFIVVAAIGFVVLEVIRYKSDKPLFAATSHFNFSSTGLEGSALYNQGRCNTCHRAMRSGTSMGLLLDGIGSRRSVTWLEQFLKDPERTYAAQTGARTLDHGVGQEAEYVMNLPPENLRKIAVFLSELRADPGSALAPMPPPERSGFIDEMVKTWAPPEWKEKYQDIRERQPAAAPNEEAGGTHGH